MRKKLTPDEMTAFMTAMARTIAVEKRSMCGPDSNIAIGIVAAQIQDDGRVTDMKTLSNIDAASLRLLLKLASDKEIDADMIIVKNTTDG